MMKGHLKSSLLRRWNLKVDIQEVVVSVLEKGEKNKVKVQK